MILHRWLTVVWLTKDLTVASFRKESTKPRITDAIRKVPSLVQLRIKLSLMDQVQLLKILWDDLKINSYPKSSHITHQNFTCLRLKGRWSIRSTEMWIRAWYSRSGIYPPQTIHKRNRWQILMEEVWWLPQLLLMINEEEIWMIPRCWLQVAIQQLNKYRAFKTN